MEFVVLTSRGGDGGGYSFVRLMCKRMRYVLVLLYECHSTFRRCMKKLQNASNGAIFLRGSARSFTIMNST